METHLPIRSWAEEDRPREKLMLKGRHSLSEAELLAILVGSGNAKETAVDVARRILSESDNDLSKLSRLGVSELQKVKGIGEAKAILIVAAFELGRRRKNAPQETPQKVTGSKEEIGRAHV